MACLIVLGTVLVSVLGHKWSQLIGPRYPRLAGSDPTPALRRGGHDLGGDSGGSLSVQVEGLSQADAPARPGASFPVFGRAAEPMRTPSKRAPCRPVFL